jgi:hypothetical protein
MPEAVIEWVIWRANHLQADVIVCTGDYVHERNSTSQIDIVWPILSQLSAPDGVYAVLGNHDHWADRDRSHYWLDRSGQNLHHRAIPLSRGNQYLWLGGAGDAWEDEDGIDQAFEHVPPGECKILLAHNPDTADFIFETHIDLILSGHTHGGQVNLPWIGTPILPVRNKRYTSGLVKTDNSQVFISKGIGWAVLPLRFNCPPEIAVLELVPTTEKQK